MTAAGRPDLDRLVRAAHVPAGEPIFLLRGRDPAAPGAVRAWARLAHELRVDLAVIEQALQQADAMARWPDQRAPDADHLTEDERKQLTYQFDRRAWRAGGGHRLGDLAEIELTAWRRGYREGLAAARRGDAA